jgi:hypothetical protein
MGRGGKGRRVRAEDGKAREGRGREGRGRGAKGREGKGREAKGRTDGWPPNINSWIRLCDLVRSYLIQCHLVRFGPILFVSHKQRPRSLLTGLLASR